MYYKQGLSKLAVTKIWVMLSPRYKTVRKNQIMEEELKIGCFSLQQLWKTKRRCYEPSQLFNACHAVQTQKMAIRKAARIFCVPESTIRRTMERLKRDDYISMDTLPKYGSGTLLKEEEEKNLVDYLTQMNAIGYDYHIRQINRMATDYAVVLGKQSPSDRILTTHWFHSFNARWPEVRICKKPKIADVREKSTSQDVLGPYYSKLKEVIEMCALTERPDSIYIVDEITLPMEHCTEGEHCKTENDTSVDERDEANKNFSIIGCGNASGSLVPPYFILPGKRWHERYLEQACSGSSGECCQGGKPHSLTMKNYFEGHFTKFVKIGKQNPVTMVLYDGHKLHHPQLTLKNWADENNVVFFALPLHASVATGLDIGCFSALKAAFKTECENRLRQTKTSSLTNFDVGKVGSSTYLKAMTQLTLDKFFKGLGIGTVHPENTDMWSNPCNCPKIKHFGFTMH